jgi:hypothetical protein
LIILAGQLRAQSKPQLLQSISSALKAPCPSAAAAPPKGAAKTEGGRWGKGGRLNTAPHKTSPHQNERPRPRRERRWLWPAALR